MQNDYHRYKEDCQRMLKKQNYLLNMLGEEKDAVETDLKNMAQAIVKQRDEMNVQSLQELCEEHNDSAKEISEEMQNLQRIEAQITDVEKQIAAENMKMGGYYRLMADNTRMQTQAVIFENRLQKATVQFNTQLTLNRKLRDEIDHLRNERALYGGLYKRLSKELQQAKEELTDTIEISTQAFEQRDEAHNKMAALKERREKDMQMHNSEMKDLLRMISHDEKIKEFIQIKSNERSEYKQEKARRIKQRCRPPLCPVIPPGGGV
ncbi:Coiled-coil domain-containing protein 63 [Lamellibrachia satsuma]|nr:Coiled-coil domain-containing protein 63 [Lamellibrachia satsuma]